MRLTLHVPAGLTAYQWKQDGEPLSDDGRIEGVNTDTLIFDPLQESDAGVYTCTFDNGVPKAEVTTNPFVLTVLAPGSLPVAGILGLGLLLASLGLGTRVALRKRSR
jgi:hypothetical protein